MDIRLSDHFTARRLLRFAFPSILMMVFTSIYGVVDGFFISNFVGKAAFAAVNFIFPYLMILGTIGFMFGSGGSALIGKTLGEGDHEKANGYFSMLVYVTIGVSVLLTVIGFFTLRPVAVLLGADEEMTGDCVLYGRIVLLALPALMLQFEFQSFFVTAEKPKLGLYATLAAGVMNMVMDALLVGVLKWGIPGAAAATALSQCVGGIAPVVYFSRKNTSLLKLGRTRFDGRALLQTCFNGASELVSNISMSFVSMLYNWQLMRFAGENGVAAYGVLMYVNFVFISVFIGFSVGTAPVFSFHYGAQNRDELKSLLKKGLTVILSFAFTMLLAGELLAKPLTALFVGYDETLFELTQRGFIIFSFSFLFASVPIFGSSFFTALNNGAVSAAISFLRTIVFQAAAVLIFPLLMGIDGIWLSLVAAEFIAAAVTVFFWIKEKRRYGY